MVCDKCGHEFKDKNKRFCPECGNNLIVQSDETKPKKRMGIKGIAILLVIFLLIVSFIIFYFIGKAKFTPENTVKAFETAVKEQDYKGVEKLLTPSQDGFKINKENTTNFVQFLNDTPAYYDQLTDQLYEQAETISSSPDKSNTTAKQDTYGTMFLSKKGKQWVIFDDYQFVVVPLFIELSAKSEDLDLYINDEKVATSSGDQDSLEKFGPFMPGVQTVKAVFENPYVTSEEVEEIEGFDSHLEAISHTFSMKVDEIEVTSLFDNYNLYVDGEETDIPLSNARNQLIGTFPTNGSVILQVGKDYPWGHVISEEKAIDSAQIGFDTVHPLTAEAQTDLMEQLNNTMKQYFAALTKNKIDDFNEGISENLLDELEKQMEKLERKHPDYDGQLREIRYDIEATTAPVFDEVLKAYTLTLEAQYFVHEPKGSINWANIGSEEENDTNIYSREITVLYDEELEEWILDSTKVGYFIVFDSNAEVFKFE